MIVVAFKKPRPERPDWIRANASALLRAQLLDRQPLAAALMKCQLSRSSESKGILGFGRLGCVGDSSNRSAVTAHAAAGRLNLTPLKPSPRRQPMPTARSP